MKFLFVVFAGLLFSGCAQQMPLMSHAHMGHSLTAWHDTPDNEALLIVAEKELVIALGESTRIAQTVNPAAQRQHFRNVINALNPDLHEDGPGLGYGAIRALQGTVDHLAYAAQSEDASNNLVTSVAELQEQSVAITSHLREALNLAMSAADSPDTQLLEIGNSLDLQLRLAVAGNARGGGNIANGELGMNGLHDGIQAMLDRETDPPYEPLPRRYVLGLVRLPNGKWGYRLPKRQTALASYGSYGY